MPKDRYGNNYPELDPEYEGSIDQHIDGLFARYEEDNDQYNDKALIAEMKSWSEKNKNGTLNKEWFQKTFPSKCENDKKGKKN